MSCDSQLLGIVTVTYNSSAVLPGFLRSLHNQSYETFRLYAVDNASSDGSADQLEAEQDSRIVVIRNADNVGFCTGSNQGISRALEDGCSYVLLLNNDTEYPENFLAELMAAANNSAAHSLFCPKIYFHSDRSRIWFAGGRFNRWLGENPRHIGEGESDDMRFDMPSEIDFITGCCMLVSPRVFQRIGLLDEKYFAYLEDADFCLRARRAGFSMSYVPSAHLYHKVSALTGGSLSAFSIRMGVRNRVYYLRKHFGVAGFLTFSALYLFLIALRFILGRETRSQFRMRLSAFWEGFQMKPSRATLPHPDKASC